MKLRWLCTALVATFVLQGSPVDAGNPFNASIAKSKRGKYKSGAIDIDLPENNPQVQTKKVEQGQTAKFFVKVKNSGQAVFNTYIGGGDLDSAKFDVSYFLNGVDVTSSYQNVCTSTPIPAEGKVLLELRILVNKAANDGDTDRFLTGEFSSNCADAHDYVWAIIKVI